LKHSYLPPNPFSFGVCVARVDRLCILSFLRMQESMYGTILPKSSQNIFANFISSSSIVRAIRLHHADNLQYDVSGYFCRITPEKFFCCQENFQTPRS
jgi:hypothetical protein